MSDQLQLIVSAQVGKPVKIDQHIELSVSSRIFETLQLDDIDVRRAYQLVPTRPEAKRMYYIAPVCGWLRLLDDLYERSNGGWSPDCAVPLSIPRQFQARLVKSLEVLP